MTKSDRTPQHQVPTIPGSYYDLITTARAYMTQRAWAEAAALQERVIARISRLPPERRRPGSDLAYFRVAAMADLVETRAELGDYAAAIELCRELQKLDPDQPAYWRRRIPLLRIQQGEVAEGLADLRALAEAEPDDLEHWIALAQQSIDHRAPALAEEALQRAEELADQRDGDKVNALVHFTRYRLYRQQERWAEAVAAWQTASVWDEEMGVRTRESIVRMLLEADLLDAALDLINDDMDAAIADFYRALIAYRRGDRIRAQHLWRTITQVDLGTKDINPALIGLAYCWLGEPRAALAYLLDTAVVQSEYTVLNAVVLGIAWAMLGNLEAAQTNFALAVQGVQLYVATGKLSRLDRWQLETLVGDEAIKAALLPYFHA